MAVPQLMNADLVVRRTGVRPDQIIDQKELRGDASDNIPGVKGIGEKTAAELLQSFETLDKLYQEVEKDSPKAKTIKTGVREKLTTHKKEALLSRVLATIKRDVQIDIELEDAAIHQYDRAKVVKLFQHFGFTSLLTKLLESAAAALTQAAFDISNPRSVPKREGQDDPLLIDEETLATLRAEVKRKQNVVLDAKTTGLS